MNPLAIVNALVLSVIDCVDCVPRADPSHEWFSPLKVSVVCRINTGSLPVIGG
jgi:hypothetical protein